MSDGARVAGYVCAGAGESWWFDGELHGQGEAVLRSRARQRIGAVRLAADSASGRVSIDGRSLGFSAALNEGEAGLYRAAARPGDPAFEAGWVVLADGTQRGATSIRDGTSNTVVTAAPTLDPSDSSVRIAGAGSVPVQKMSPSIIAILIG